MEKNYEESLPEGYKQVYHIDATDKKTGFLFTLASLGLLILPLAILLPIYLCTKEFEFVHDIKTIVSLFSFCFLLILYIIAHELVHGIVYKALTKQKLTFGISWSCAYCGVPNVYVYRKAAIMALLAPFTVFSILFLGITIGFYFYDGLLYILIATLFSIHISGCVGDLFMTYLFLFKFKDPTILMKDTGPEQFIYQKEN